MKKDKDWLSEQVGDLNSTHAVFNESGVSYIDTVVSMERVYELIDQLDEPEVLSQEWIDENEEQEEMYGSYGVPVHKLQNLLVPKKELPVIPRFVAEWIEGRKEIGFPIYQSIRVVREDSRFEDSHLREWLWTNKGQEVFARAWLDGYKVAEEPLFYVVDKNDKVLWYRFLGGEPEISGATLKNVQKSNSKKRYQFTEQEIKDYDPRYWAFAVPVEDVEDER